MPLTTQHVCNGHSPGEGTHCDRRRSCRFYMEPPQACVVLVHHMFWCRYDDHFEPFNPGISGKAGPAQHG